MARPPNDHSIDSPESVEEVDLDDDDDTARTGKLTGSGRPDLPDGVIALRTKSNRDRFYLTITTVVEKLGYDVGEDYLFCMYQPADQNIPERLVLEHVPDPGKEDKRSSKTRKIIDNQSAARYTLPKTELGEYGVGIDVDDYDGEDPFLFEPVFLDDPSTFLLVPLGRVSEVFRYDTRIEPPYPSSLVDTAAAEEDVDVSELQETLGMVAKTLSKETFEAAGIPVDEDAVVVSVDGQRLAVYFAPVSRGRSAFDELLTGIYGASPGVAAAIRRLNQEYANTLLSGLQTDGEDSSETPGMDRVRAQDREAIVVPLDPPAAGEDSTEADESTNEEAWTQTTLGDAGGVQRTVPVPVEKSIESLASRTHEVDPDRVHEVLSEIARDPPRDELEEIADGADLSPVTLPVDAVRDEPGGYENVEVVFVEEDGLAELLVGLGVDEAVAEAVRDAHNKQAGKLIAKQSNAPPKYRRFEEHCDAVLIPVLNG